LGIFQQDNGSLLIPRRRREPAAGMLRGGINAALTSRLRDYASCSSAWDLMQVRISKRPRPPREDATTLSLSLFLSLPGNPGRSGRAEAVTAPRKHLSTN
jgi:hypothetical protein